MGSQDWGALSRLVEQAVEELAGMTSGRPVGGAYYLYRTLRRLDLDLMREMLVEMMEMEGSHPGIGEDALAERLRSEQVDDLLERLKELNGEIVGDIADRGVDNPVAATLRSAPGRTDLMHASESQLADSKKLTGASPQVGAVCPRTSPARAVLNCAVPSGLPLHPWRSLDVRFRSVRRFVLRFLRLRCVRIMANLALSLSRSPPTPCRRGFQFAGLAFVRGG